MLTVGIGYIGLTHDRLSGCDLRRYRDADWSVVNWRGLAWHSAVGLFGWWLLNHGGRREA